MLEVTSCLATLARGISGLNSVLKAPKRLRRSCLSGGSAEACHRLAFFRRKDEPSGSLSIVDPHLKGLLNPDTHVLSKIFY